MIWLQRILAVFRSSVERPPEPASFRSAAELEERLDDLKRRLGETDRHLRDAGDTLYRLQQRYSSEHFDFQETMRNLKIERMRNAGIRAARDVVLRRCGALAQRAAGLKARLRRYEDVSSEEIDDQEGAT